jgi:uncharacterized caspase-like protein
MRIALLTIGINYRGQANELAGCVNDSNRIKTVLQARLGNRITNMVQMTDLRPKTSKFYPTRKNIEHELCHLRALARQNKIDGIIFHFSGHGGSVVDHNGDEADGRDETLVPVDYQSAGQITDDFMNDHILSRLPRRTQFLGIVDACHSGTVMDLRYGFQPINSRQLRERVDNTKAIRGRPHMLLSGCVDGSYSYDVTDKQFGAAGAFTSAFLRAIRGQPRPRVGRVIRSIRSEIKSLNLPQLPQFTASFRCHNDTRLLLL